MLRTISLKSSKQTRASRLKKLQKTDEGAGTRVVVTKMTKKEVVVVWSKKEVEKIV